MTDTFEPWNAHNTKATEAPHVVLTSPMEPLSLPMLPPSAADLLGSFNAGLAGLLLAFSSLFRGPKLGLLMLPAAAITVAGHRFGMVRVPPLHDARQTALACGGALAGLALFFGRAK